MTKDNVWKFYGIKPSELGEMLIWKISDQSGLEIQNLTTPKNFWKKLQKLFEGIRRWKKDMEGPTKHGKVAKKPVKGEKNRLDTSQNEKK